MIASGDYDICQCGHIRADHLPPEINEGSSSACRAYYKASDQILYPCECNAFDQDTAAASPPKGGTDG